MVGFCSYLGGSCRDEGGPPRYLITYFCRYSREHFADSVSGNYGLAVIRFGYRLFGLRLYYQKLAVHKIESVEWSTGQATHMAGRDMNDWTVGIWYDHDDPRNSIKGRKLQRWKPDQDICIVGPSGPKAHSESQGQALLGFLKRQGHHW